MRLPGVIVFCVAALVAAGSLCAQNTRTQENKKAKLEKEIALIDKQLKDNTAKSRSALSELTLVRKKISNRNELIARSDADIKELENGISVKKSEIAARQAHLDTLSMYYVRLVRTAYKNRDSKLWYMYILSSESIGQAARRVSYLRSLSGQMNAAARRVREAKDSLESENKRLEALLGEAQTLRDQRVQEVTSLKKEEGESRNLVSRLNRDGAKYRKELNAKKKQVEALNREIARLIREAAGGVAKNSSKPKTQIDQALDKEFANNRGRLPWPVDGPVVDKFGQHNHPVFTKVVMPFNNGISIAVDPGTKVRAVFDGVVKQIVMMPGYNQCVLVQHGGYFSFYCKLDGCSVKAGDKIKTGAVIGTVAKIGDESQLHFQIWKGTTPQNPELWLK